MEIESGIYTGTMPRRALALVQQWRKSRTSDLLHDWKLAEEKKDLSAIKPLE